MVTTYSATLGSGKMSKLPRIVKGERQKELVRIFDDACGRNNRWTVWGDFIVMAAISISNTVDKSHAESREDMYRTLVKKYNKRELDCLVRMFALIVEAMDEDPDQDFLGDLYMSLGLGNEKSGQFFTPYSVCKAMAKMNGNITAEVEKKGWISVNDPACGAGALLVAFVNECKLLGINYQTSVLCVAQDIDFVTGCMCYIQLSLLGCPGYVVIADTIAHPSTSIDKRGLIPVHGENVWYTPMYFRDVWHWRRVWTRMDLMIQSEAAPQLAEPLEPEEPPQQEIPAEQAEDLKEGKFGQLSLF